MSASTVARYYKKYGIKKKRIAFKKKLPKNTEANRENILGKIKQDL